VTATAGAAAFGLASPFAAWGLLRQRPRLVYGAAATAAATFLLGAVLVLHPALGRDRSAAALVEDLAEFAERPLILVDVRVPSLTFYLDRVPERIAAGDLAPRLDRSDLPVVVISSAGLARISPEVRVRLREFARSGKLHVFCEVEPSPAPVPR
jgi:hypothetical protein